MTNLKIELTVEFVPLPKERRAGFWRALGMPLDPLEWAASEPKQEAAEEECEEDICQTEIQFPGSR